LLTEKTLTEAVCLVARMKHLETELARSRDSLRINELSGRLDAIRWTLLNEYDVKISPWSGKLPVPVGDITA
jgi:hypothetical protein